MFAVQSCPPLCRRAEGAGRADAGDVEEETDDQGGREGSSILIW